MVRVKLVHAALAVVALAVISTRAAESEYPVKNFVVITLENRSFSHMLGWLKKLNPAVRGLTGSEFNPMNASDPESEKVFVSADAVYIGPAPEHSVPSMTDQIFGHGRIADQPNVYEPTMDGFVQDLEATGQRGVDVMKCFNETMLPVFYTLAQEGAVFDMWFPSIPGPTEVNRCYMWSSTSHGTITNNGPQLAEGYPQETMFATLKDAGLTFADYYSDFPTAFFMRQSRRIGFIEHFHLLPTFKKDAAAGTLPTLSILEPRYFHLGDVGANDAHPDHDVRLAELFVKEVYEALRAGPQWNETVLIVTFDENGGFYDNVVPPGSEPACDGNKCVPNPDGMDADDPAFDFGRLGPRIPVIMVSPWINANTVVHEGDGPTPTSAYEHSSIHATLKKMFGLPRFLTKRDEWASTFEDVFMGRSTPRTDLPRTLPTPPGLYAHPSPAGPLDPYTHDVLAKLPVSDFQQNMILVTAALNDDDDGVDAAALANIDSMSNADAGLYVTRQVERFVARGKDLARRHAD